MISQVFWGSHFADSLGIGDTLNFLWIRNLWQTAVIKALVPELVLDRCFYFVSIVLFCVLFFNC